MRPHPFRPVRAGAVLMLMLLSAGPRLFASGNDPDAGNWRYILLTGPGQFPVAEPAPFTDAAYQAELAPLKGAQAPLTKQQRDPIHYSPQSALLRSPNTNPHYLPRPDLP